MYHFDHAVTLGTNVSILEYVFLSPMLRWGVTKLGKPRSDDSDVIASFPSSFTGLSQASRMGNQEAEILQRPALRLDHSARLV